MPLILRFCEKCGLERAIILFNHLVENNYILDFTIQKYGSGNWDNIEIEKSIKDLGLSLDTSSQVFRDVKKHFS